MLMQMQVQLCKPNTLGVTTSRGSKLINLYVAFECALHMFACMAQVLKFPIHACVVYASF